jgi:Ca2+-binding RTX toxin-like protein
MSLNIIARKDYEDLQKNILNEKEQENKKVACPLFFISQTQFDNLPSYSGGSNSPSTPGQVGSDESETLVGSEVNNTFISNAGNDTLKDTAGGNDIYKFKKGDGADTIYDIKGNDTIIFDESVLKSDVTFSQSEDLKSLIINYSPTDSITITNYFDSFSKIENIQLSDGTKLTPQFNNTIIGRDISDFFLFDEVRKVA